VKIKPFAKWFSETFDERDGVLLVGLCLLGAGIWPLSHEWALIVPGAVLTFHSVRG
jgi:hypothetical protein